MYNINSSSGGGGGARSLPSTPYCHSSSPVVGGLPRHWNAVPPPAEMMPLVPMFGDRNRHSNNGDNNYNRQYPNTSRGHFPNYWHNCGGTTCGPSHHWEDSQRIDRTHQANTKCFKVPQNRDNSLISGQTPEGIKRICGGSGFNNYSRDINTSRLSYYGMPPSGNHSYNGINNSQHSFPQRKSPSTFYGGNNHNCDNNRWNGQNHAYNQTSQPSRNQRTPSPYFDTKKQQQQQQQRGISPYQQSGSESDEIEHFFNPIQNNSTHIGLHGANGPSLPTELLVTSLDQSIDPKKMKMILGTIFSEHVKVLNISTFVQSDGNYAASVKVPSLQDAQYAISQLHRLLAGYARGNILMIDCTNGKVLRLLTDVHTPGTAVLHIKFTDSSKLALCSDSGGSVFELSFTRTMGVRGCDSKCLFSGSRGEVCTIEPLLLNTLPRHPLKNYTIIALATLSRVLVICIKPRMRIILTHSLTGPPKTSPQISWQLVIIQKSDSNKIIDPVLAIARDKIIYFYQVSSEAGSRVRLLPLRRMTLSYIICNLRWLNTRSLIVFDNNEYLHLIDVRTQEDLEIIDMNSVGISYGSSYFKGLTTGGNVSKAMAATGEYACYNTIITYGN